MVTVIESNLVIENAQLKQRVAELEAALAQYENGDVITYAGKKYELVHRAATYGDLVMFEHTNTTLIAPKKAYRLTFFSNKPRFVLENNMVVGLNDSAVQRSVSGMKVYALMRGGE